MDAVKRRRGWGGRRVIIGTGLWIASRFRRKWRRSLVLRHSGIFFADNIRLDGLGIT